MLQKTKLKIVFWGCLILGIGLCIGGIFVEPLLIPGAALIAGALGMYQSAFGNLQENPANAPMQDHIAEASNMVPEHVTIPTPSAVAIQQNIGVYFMYRPRFNSEDAFDECPDRPRNPHIESRLTLT